VNRLWLLVLAATLGLMLFLQHRGIEQSSSDFVSRMPRLPAPSIRFIDGEGAKIGSLEELRGKFVLLNIWATWCAPCRKEIPGLDRLQGQLGGSGFQVVALSVDREGAEAVRIFYRAIGILNLSVRVAADSDALAELGGYGLPITLLIDRQSRVIGRLVGSTDWDSKGMIDFVKKTIEQ
jgi:thiol-disulfide isomerase/thioredoxin